MNIIMSLIIALVFFYRFLSFLICSNAQLKIVFVHKLICHRAETLQIRILYALHCYVPKHQYLNYFYVQFDQQPHKVLQGLEGKRFELRSQQHVVIISQKKKKKYQQPHVTIHFKDNHNSNKVNVFKTQINTIFISLLYVSSAYIICSLYVRLYVEIQKRNFIHMYFM